MANHLNAAREMLARAKEDPKASRYYGPGDPTIQRAIYLQCAGLYFDNHYHELYWKNHLTELHARQYLNRKARIGRAIFNSAVIREIIKRDSSNRRLP